MPLLMQHDRNPVFKLEITPNHLAKAKRRLLEANGLRTQFELSQEISTNVLRAARVVVLSEVGS